MRAEELELDLHMIQEGRAPLFLSSPVYQSTTKSKLELAGARLEQYF